MSSFARKIRRAAAWTDEGRPLRKEYRKAAKKAAIQKAINALPKKVEIVGGEPEAPPPEPPRRPQGPKG